MTSERPWHGLWALGDGWLTYSGPIGPTDRHRHHAMQLIGQRVGAVEAIIDERPARGRVLIIPPDVPHRITSSADQGWIVFVDHRSRLGRARIATTPNYNDVLFDQSPGDTYADLERFTLRAVEQWSGAGAERRSTDLHWATEQALSQIPRLVAHDRTSTSIIARHVGVSPSRLTHVFSRDTGTTLSAYLRWVRLRTAVGRIASGASVTEAAHAAGFADAAHFSRSFRSMFGLTPARTLTMGRWITA